MSEESTKATNDLIRWLKMLALPTWAKFALGALMLLILCSALGLLFWGLIEGKSEVISSAVAILTVGLPIGLIVVALVFGDGGASKLKALTTFVLSKEVPGAIAENLKSSAGEFYYQNAKIESTLSGCIADYVLSADARHGDDPDTSRPIFLEFKLELNVKKVNFVVWLPTSREEAPVDLSQRLKRYQSCFFGATQEGYLQNTNPLYNDRAGFVGFVFIRPLSADFLLNAGERLYFAQDLAFFVRGLLTVELSHG